MRTIPYAILLTGALTFTGCYTELAILSQMGDGPSGGTTILYDPLPPPRPCHNCGQPPPPPPQPAPQPVISDPAPQNPHRDSGTQRAPDADRSDRTGRPVTLPSRGH